jgi:enoyl-CoA hydratase/carnithine racemase
MTTPASPIHLERHGHVALVELDAPPHNHIDLPLMRALVEGFEALDADSGCRAVVLAARGRIFCAGANLGHDGGVKAVATDELYALGLRLFRIGKPMVAAVQGAAVGGGLGLAMVADFRVTCEEARFVANFTRLGLHPGFGLSVTLPRAIGVHKADLLFATGRRIGGREAASLGLADVLVPLVEVRAAALALAQEIATSAPLAVQATRRTLRAGLVDAVRTAIAHELDLQEAQLATADYAEGRAAATERREPVFSGR